MAKPILLKAFALCFLLLSCSKERYAAITPAYLSIPAIHLQTDYATEGTAHHKITTAWVLANNNPVGVFELPCTIPITHTGNTNIKVIPGINMNGIKSTRAIYNAYKPIEESIELTALDTVTLNGDTSLFTSFDPNHDKVLIEDFDNTGLNFEKDALSDTNFIKTNDSLEAFTYLNENNGNAGKLILDGDKDYFEVFSTNKFTAPTGNQEVFLELSYKTNMPVYIGIVGENNSATQQLVTLYLYESDDWNKIYINLITEINSISGIQNFKIFFGGDKPNDIDVGEFFIDNIRLVYQ